MPFSAAFTTTCASLPLHNPVPHPAAVGAEGVNVIWLIKVDGFTVAFAAAETFSESRTVISTGVSAVTGPGMTVNVEPVTVAVTGKTTLLLVNAL